MRVKEAPWEIRNLGVDTCEFYIEQRDAASEVVDAINACIASYQVLHIQSGNSAALMEAQNNGFSFIEMNFQLKVKMEEFELPIVYKRFIPNVSYSIATNAEKERVLEIIQSGEMFLTDKVARDPYFGKEKAGYRYACWMQDVLEAGAVLLILKYKDQPIGFDTIVTHDGGVAEAFLGGVFPEYEGKGLGFVGIYMVAVWMKEHGYKIMQTGVSSNNLPILRLHEAFGFHIDSMSYTLIKHT